jgi:hypothetical protein
MRCASSTVRATGLAAALAFALASAPARAQQHPEERLPAEPGPHIEIMPDAPPPPPRPPDGGVACTKTEFEDVVDGAAAALRDLNNKNRPEFQDRLRQLKEKRGWTNDQFLKEAAPYVKDDRIDVYDQTSNELLAKITEMGQGGADAKTPDCALLAQLQGHMQELVGTQIRKWTYMFAKLDKELAH